jgi:MoxR-like ATPase
VTVGDGTLSCSELAERGERIVQEIERAVVGKRDALELVLLGLLANGHVLIEDNPGLAKTLIARSFAAATSLRFTRVQFTPDLMPADITGSNVYDQLRGTVSFRPGPIFTNILLGDEINRAPPKTQAALLEAMQERQVTVEDGTRQLERPFLVLATQNPIEYEGTYPLPEAQLDRFLLRIAVGYPDVEAEVELLARRLARDSDEVELSAIVDREQLIAMQQAVERVYVADSVVRYIVAIAAATRSSPQVQVGASPRGTLALLGLARARAALDGRDFVVPDDVKAVAVPALAHRIALRPELWVKRVAPGDVVGECLASVPAPIVEPGGPATA